MNKLNQFTLFATSYFAKEINLCTNTYCINIQNFIPFDEKVIMLPDFKNNMFHHHGTQ